jgi:hypothetical protein
VNNGKLEILLYSSDFIVLRLGEFYRGQMAHPSSSREDRHSVMPDRIDSNLFLTSLGKVVSLATQSTLLGFLTVRKYLC